MNIIKSPQYHFSLR